MLHSARKSRNTCCRGESAYHPRVIPESAMPIRRPLRTLPTPRGELRFGRRCLIMGVLNVTPDSFSDGGRFLSTGDAVAYAVEMQRDGADVIDIGGESTRPGSTGVPTEEQITRVVPVIRAARAAGVTTPISIDTRDAAVARAAIDAGADIINDVSGARHDPAMPRLLADSGAPFIIMHMLGTPQTMQRDPHYQDVVADVGAFFDERAEALAAAGIDVDRRMIVDPGIGFGKTRAHNLALIRAAAAEFGAKRPLLIGVSRKRLVGELLGEADPAAPGAAASPARLFGTAAAVAHAALAGADLVRVHDVAAMRAVVEVCAGIAYDTPPAPCEAR